jgi:hypothetical protein
MWGAFEISAINNAEISALPNKDRVLDGLFQAFGIFFFFSEHDLWNEANRNKAVRGGGFSVVAFDRLPQGLLMLYGTCFTPSIWKPHFANKFGSRTHDGEKSYVIKQRSQ